MKKQVRVVPIVLVSVAAAAVLGLVGVATNLIPLPEGLHLREDDIL